MAQVTNFKDRIADYAGSLAESDDDALIQYTIDCCQEVAKTLSIKKADDLFKFTVRSGFITSGDPTSVMNIKNVIAVVRDGIQATEGNALTAISYRDDGSIYYATRRDPKFWVENGSLSIAPDPSGTEPAYYLYIPEFSVENFSSGITKIVDADSGAEVFPPKYYESLILCVALKVLNRRLNDYLETDEDIELVNGIQSQMARLDAEYKKLLGLE
tara:strand:+ start:284 stop:928 length:645 start_codon:yes stop_codon:yes gene_type:complete